MKKNTMKKQSKTFNVCYLREYMDPECPSDYFEAYETIYRNVPEKYRSKFDTKEMKLKILKFGPFLVVFCFVDCVVDVFMEGFR